MTHAELTALVPRPWGTVNLSPHETRALRFGPRDLWLGSRDGEIWVTHRTSPASVDPAEATAGRLSGDPPDELGWSRWATPSDERELFLRPVFPDRTLVLEPELPFRLLPQSKARIYVRVPLWIRLELVSRPPDRSSTILEEVPSAALSDTWWGGFMDGELAYWLPTTARREMRPDLFHAHLAVCPLLLTNRSPAYLRVEKLSFRIAHLSLFVHDGHLWADESIVAYRGEEEGSHVEMTGRPPAEVHDAQLVTPPRIPVHKGFRARTFDRIMSLPGLGGG